MSSFGDLDSNDFVRRKAETFGNATPLASVPSASFEYSHCEKTELRDADLEARLERLSSQHIYSDYNKARRQTLAHGKKAATTATYRLPLSTSSTARSSYTSITVESPPHAVRTPSSTTPTRSSEHMECVDEQVTPTAKRRYLRSEVHTEERSLVQEDSITSAMRGHCLSTEPMAADDLPPTVKTSLTHPLKSVYTKLLSLFGSYLLGPPPEDPPIRSRSSSPVHFAPSSPPRRGLSRPRLSSQTSSLRTSPVPRESRIVRPVKEPCHLVQHARHSGHGPLDLWSMTCSPEPRPVPPSTSALPCTAFPSPSAEGRPGPIGNLLLSSCPGKSACTSSVGMVSSVDPLTEVRLTVPVARGGRSAICRDLRTDLQRVKEAGARAIVCCLDNDELEMLGSPWTEYYPVTQELGMEVYRLPMTEGEGPLGGSSVLDAMLEVVLAKHTLRGQSVLVHCRGGVGRAGLFACAWILKLQLVSSSALSDFHLAERVVDVVRRRRSMKSIETPAQARQVLDYIHYLSTLTKGVRAEEVLAAW